MRSSSTTNQRLVNVIISGEELIRIASFCLRDAGIDPSIITPKEIIEIGVLVWVSYQFPNSDVLDYAPDDITCFYAENKMAGRNFTDSDFIRINRICDYIWGFINSVMTSVINLPKLSRATFGHWIANDFTVIAYPLNPRI